MILKVWDEGGGWVYFDRVDTISIFPHNALGEGEDQGYPGGIYVKTLKEKFKVATIHRTWHHRTEGELGESMTLAFNEGYLLGDDGQTIERL